MFGDWTLRGLEVRVSGKADQGMFGAVIMCGNLVILGKGSQNIGSYFATFTNFGR